MRASSARRSSGSPTRVALVTQVDFWRARAGHHARILSLAQALAARVALTLVAPLPLDPATRARIRAAVPLARVHSLELPVSGARRDALKALRGFFDAAPQDACIIEYLVLDWMRAAVPPGVLTFVDTHDVVSQRDADLAAMGAPMNRSVLSAEDERQRLQAFDHVIAISRPDAEVFTQWLGAGRVLLAPHTHTLHPTPLRAEVQRLLFVGSVYAPNLDGLRWFLDAVWPRLPGRGWVLAVVGAIGPAMQLSPTAVLQVHGVVPDLHAVYAAADLCINPVRLGSGLKIKTVEALAHGRPLVASPHAVRGLEHGSGRAFMVAETADLFARALSLLASQPSERRRLADGALAFAAQEFSNVNGYAALLDALSA